MRSLLKKRILCLTDLEQCDREIAEAEAYLRTGGVKEMELALMGLHDWLREKRLIEEEDGP